MPINFAINLNNKSRTFSYAIIIMVLAVSQFLCIFILDASQIAVVRFRMPNITAVHVDLYSDIPHEDCRCSVIPTKGCINNIQLKIFRVLPLILFVLEVCFIREHFILSGDYTYFLVNIYWIVSIFVFFGIFIIIHRSSYYYDWIGLILYGISLLLFLYFFPHVRPENQHTRYSHNNV